ncbi:hypothetical protein RBG61_03445 [Paludicola sp. MB14-C6]|uniref:hypothetical protein n=1 Tax=Paludihabitans sp. MB14-C6 TaxID=3070656 RepID=UPI0027DC77CC|nr:hypothetical protein [Paludicola sp. MB14-C6]WMJ23729.1 hypothetical protein RBG61_03445 [Paludicola sp. MB14-C6]
MKIKQLILGIVIVGVISATIITTKILGFWNTTSTKIPVKYQSGQFAGEYNPNDIRGSYTFKEISDLFKIPLNDLGKAFISNKDSYDTIACKDLETIYQTESQNAKEVGTNSVRIFVALYKGFKIELDNTTYFPETAKEILLSKGNLTNEQTEFINTHLVSVKSSLTNNSSSESEESENFIKGKTIFKEVFANGVKQEELEEVMGVKIDNTTAVIRDFCASKGLDFSKVKADIQNLINKK